MLGSERSTVMLTLPGWSQEIAKLPRARTAASCISHALTAARIPSSMSGFRYPTCWLPTNTETRCLPSSSCAE